MGRESEDCIFGSVRDLKSEKMRMRFGNGWEFVIMEMRLEESLE